MNEIQLIYLLICLFIIVIILNLLILFKIKNDKFKDYKKDLEDFKFNLQTQFMNIQKSLSDDFSHLRENIIINITKYNEHTVKELLMSQNKMSQDLYIFKDNMQKDMYLLFENLNKSLNDNLEKINDRVDFRLNEGFERTNKTFNNIIERLSKIDEAQRKIESLSTNIISLQDILMDKKARGTFGEIQLKQILTAIFGENNIKIYELQKKLSNDKIADAVIYTPEPLGVLCIDSKFPLENYKKMIDKNLSQIENLEAERLFKQDIKKHINDIKEKYIIKNETADQAIMFVPAEAIFAEINAYHQDIIDYSQKNQVWIASPTTLMFLLTTVQVVIRNLERDKYSAIIHEELNRLGTEFKRYKERWDKLSKNIDQVSKNVKELHTTSDKIEKHFDSISRVDLNTEEVMLINYDEEENNETSSN